MTPNDLISVAEGLAFPFAAPHTVAPGVLLRELTFLDMEVVGIFQVNAPERLSAAGTDITVAAASNANGYTLTDADTYIDFQWVSADGVLTPIRIVPETLFENPPVHPAGIVRGSKFYPADPLRRRWADTGWRPYFAGNGDKIAYRYLASAVALTSLSQTLASPPEAQPYLQWSLVLSILLAAGNVPVETLQRVAAERNQARESLNYAAATRTGV